MKRTTLAAWLAIAAMQTSQLTAQEKQVNLAGRWVMDTRQSDYGRMPVPKSMIEIIEQKDKAITVSATSMEPRGETKSFLKLATDGSESLNDVNGNEFRSTSRWDGAKLVTTVTGDRGMRMVEVRFLSADGNTQTVETYLGEMRGAPQMKRVMLKKDR